MLSIKDIQNATLIYHDDIEQGTDEWNMVKKGFFSGSKSEIVANGLSKDLKRIRRKDVKEALWVDEKGNPTMYHKDTGKIVEGALQDGFITLCRKIFAEQLSSGPSRDSGFYNVHTEAGVKLEDVAIEKYHSITGYEVKKTGFVELAGMMFGFSPDGLVGDNGLIEVKNPDVAGFGTFLRKGSRAISTAYMYQMQWMMLFGRRAWCDFIVHNPNFKHLDIDTIIMRIYPNSSYVEKIIQGAGIGEKLVFQYHEEAKHTMLQLQYGLSLLQRQ